jgi:hypothetical protein
MIRAPLALIALLALAGPAAADTLEPLVPAVAANPWGIEPGRRPFQHRLAVGVGAGALGAERLFALQLAYHPSSWLGWEGMLAHNPGQAVHAVLHSMSAIVRRPVSGRLQPYLALGYGMVMVSPGPSINADPVTKNALTAGGGLEAYLRSDLAVRGDVRHATIVGSDDGGLVAYPYLQYTLGLSFQRTIRP